MLRHLSSLIVTVYHAYVAGATRVNSGYRPPSQPPRESSGEGQSASGQAIATLVLGIASWTPALPLIGAIVGAILGWLELKKIERGESPAAGRTITKVGFWLSIANIAFSVLMGLFALLMVLFVFGSFAAMLSAIGQAAAM